MLKGIPAVISPDLMKVLMEMGHGDEIIFGDANFPAAAHAKRLIRFDGISIPVLLDAVMQYFPLDYTVSEPVCLVRVPPTVDYVPTIWDTYRACVGKYDAKAGYEYMDRFAFYERAKSAYAIVATGERSRFANILLKKGIVVE